MSRVGAAIKPRIDAIIGAKPEHISGAPPARIPALKEQTTKRNEAIKKLHERTSSSKEEKIEIVSDEFPSTSRR